MAESLKDRVERLKREPLEQTIAVPPIYQEDLPMEVGEHYSRLDNVFEATKKVCAIIAMVVGTFFLVAFTTWFMLSVCKVI